MNWLEDIFGKDYSDDQIDLLTISGDASGLKGKATAIVWPTDEAQIHKLIQHANRKNLNLTIRGAGTGLAGGCVPEDSIVIDMSKMNRMIQIIPQDKEVVCQPGVVIDDLNQALDKYDLFFPIIPSSSSVCQVGGAAATNAAGLRALEYGKTEDWVKYIEFFDGTGKLIKMKNPREFIGTEGILGIATKLRLKLTEPPKKKTISVIKSGSVDELMEHIEKYRTDQNVSSIEYFNKVVAGLTGHKEADHLIVEFNDDRGEIEEPDEIAKIWEMRRGLGPRLSEMGYSVMEDPYVPDRSLKKFIRWLVNNKVPSFGHIGIGIFHPRFKKTQHSLIKEMFEFVRKNGGSASGEHGIGLSKKEYIDPVRRDELKELKKKYDPKGIMNRGKVI